MPTTADILAAMKQDNSAPMGRLALDPTKLMSVLNALKGAGQSAFNSIDNFMSHGYSPGTNDVAGVKNSADVSALLGALGTPMAEKGAIGVFGGKHATGWDKAQNKYIGSDMNPKFEIPDQKMEWTSYAKALDPNNDYVRPISMFLNHPELYKQYPDAKNIGLSVSKSNTKGTSAFTQDNTIHMHPQDVNSEYGLDLATHELQHWLQRNEKFAKGGTGMDINYPRLGGEVEADNAMARRKMTNEQRTQFPPNATERVEAKNQVYKYFPDDYYYNHILEALK